MPVGLRAYYDGSGRPGTAVALGGYAATQAVWQEFELEWARVLSDDNIRPSCRYLHMNEANKGDVLGLSGSDVPKTPDPSAESDPESITQRPEIARVGDILGLAETSEELTQNAGATGTDQRSGGSGADDAEE